MTTTSIPHEKHSPGAAMTDAERFLKLFPSNPQSYVVRKSTGARNENGKIPAEYATRRGQVTPALVDLHLDGKQCLVLKPDFPDGTCQWGTLDHDRYSSQTVALLADEIRAQGLPLYPFRSKSGGMHDFFFLRSPQPIPRVRAQLGGYAKVLGDPDCESFPKPVAKDKQAFGMCMPFLGRREAFREFHPELYDGPLAEAPEEEPRVFSEPGRALPAGLLERILGKLIYEKRVEGAATFYDYHGLRGKDGKWQECLVAGRVHDAHRDNPRQATWKVENGKLSHQCFHKECRARAGSHTEIALKALGLENFKAPNGAPSRTTNPGFSLTSLRDLMSEPEEKVSWLLAEKLPAGGISVLSAKPKVGKSTLARCLALAVARGEPFLGCRTTKGPVIYLALEEKRSEVRRHFADLGATATGDEQIQIHCAAAPKDAMSGLSKIVTERKPVLVIIDPLFKFVRVVDEKAYAEMCYAIEPLLTLARETGAHVLLVHHNGKAERADAMDAILGSTAIFGGVDAGLVLKRTDRYRTLQSSQKYGTDWPETVLEFDSERRALSLGVEKSEAEAERTSQAILVYLRASEEPRTREEIEAQVEGDTGPKRKALKLLVEQGKVGREGIGRRGDPFKYRFLFACLQHIEKTTKQETEKGGELRENIDDILVCGEAQKSFLVCCENQDERVPRGGDDGEAPTKPTKPPAGTQGRNLELAPRAQGTLPSEKDETNATGEEDALEPPRARGTDGLDDDEVRL